jgi:hypothetical protein
MGVDMRLVLALTHLFVPAAMAGSLNLCLSLRVPVPGDVLTITSQELLRYSPVLNSKVTFTCSEDALRISLESRPPASMPEDALGAARTRNGRVLPDLRVFYDSVQERLPARSPQTVARALALVIAHEALHYLRQDLGHAEDGIQAPVFSGRDLERGAQYWAKQTALVAASRQ